MHRYYEYLKRTQKNLAENLEKYLKALRDLAERYGGKAYVFGSYIKGEYIAASDIDVLIEIPDSVDRLQVLHEARRLVPNRRVEIHVLNYSDAEVFKRLIRDYKEIN